mgnify:FL=1
MESYERANSFYIAANETADELAQYFQSNNDKGLQLNFLTEEGMTSCEILYAFGPLINHYQYSNNRLVIVFYVTICIGVFLVAILGVYSYIQIKRCAQYRTPSRLVSPMSTDGEELTIQYA